MSKKERASLEVTVRPHGHLLSKMKWSGRPARRPGSVGRALWAGPPVGRALWAGRVLTSLVGWARADWALKHGWALRRVLGCAALFGPLQSLSLFVSLAALSSPLSLSLSLSPWLRCRPPSVCTIRRREEHAWRIVERTESNVFRYTQGGARVAAAGAAGEHGPGLGQARAGHARCTGSQ